MIEIVVPRSVARRVAAGLLLAWFVMAGLLGSPRSQAGRPVLLLPEVRAVEAYRREVAAWTRDWRALDTDLNQLLGEPDADLLALGRDSQRGFERAVDLAREVDAAEAPPAMLGLHDQAVAAAGAYVDAAVAVARWVSAPSETHRTEAAEALAVARAVWESLSQNDWIAGG